MWASKSLSLLWMRLPRCKSSAVDVTWSSPMLAVPDCVTPMLFPVIPQEPKSNRLAEWFWRVDVQFGAWARRAVQRAQSLRAPLEESLKERYSIVLAYLDELDPANGSRVIEQAAAGPVSLSGREMIASLVNHARFGLCPKWDGWEALAAIDDGRRETKRK